MKTLSLSEAKMKLSAVIDEIGATPKASEKTSKMV
jgi:hypothetical protein